MEKLDESSNIKRLVLVAGATGRSGVSIVKNLINKGIRVRILIKNVEKAKKLFSLEEFQNLDLIVECDIVKDKDFKEKLKNCFQVNENNTEFYVISALSYRFEPYQSCEEGNLTTNSRLIDAAKDSNLVRKFILLSSTHVTKPFSYISITCNLNRKYMQYYKVLVEDYLRKSKINYLIIRPVGLRVDYTPTAFTLDKGDKVEGKINLGTLGRLVSDMILDSKIADNLTVECISYEKQFDQPYKYSSDCCKFESDTENEKKMIDHLWPCRIVGFGIP